MSMSAFCRPLFAAGFAAMLATPGLAADGKSAGASAERGRVVFERQCAPCHGQGPGDDGSPKLPGTAALDRKYSGEVPGALEHRADLDVDILRFFLRNGSGAMPMFRKAELTDAAIADIAAYLKSSAAAHRD
ncbi:MAG TPA: cytochrome c [Sphingobium sp.]|nr:cytochrome c [Sphingobium sp.]